MHRQCAHNSSYVMYLSVSGESKQQISQLNSVCEHRGCEIQLVLPKHMQSERCMFTSSTLERAKSLQLPPVDCKDVNASLNATYIKVYFLFVFFVHQPIN